MSAFKKVLVTGGAGFIGSHTVDRLLERGYEVRVFDNLEPQVHGDLGGKPPPYLNTGAEFILGDVRDRDALKAAMLGCDAVIHDAAMVGVGQSQFQVRRYMDVNTGGTANLMDILVNDKLPVERILVASSMSIYGEGLYQRPSDGAARWPALRPDAQLDARDFEMRDPETGEALTPLPTSEDKPLICTSVYALSKKDQEELTLITARAHGLSAVACRYFNVYGPRQALSNPYTGAAAIFSSRIKNGNSPLVYEDGAQLRDFVNVQDIVSAKVFLLENPQANLEAYNICTGKPTSVLRLASLLCELHDRTDIPPRTVESYRSGDIRHCYGDPSKLAALGWTAQVKFEDGLRELVAWCEGQEAEDHVEQAHRELVAKGLVKEAVHA